jgi:hypothetical protein
VRSTGEQQSQCRQNHRPAHRHAPPQNDANASILPGFGELEGGDCRAGASAHIVGAMTFHCSRWRRTGMPIITFRLGASGDSASALGLKPALQTFAQLPK